MNRGLEIETPIKATELFPDLDEDIDRRILHSETRIKYWVIVGVLVNVLAVIGLGAPLIYYLGTMQAQATAAIASLNKSDEVQDRQDRWIRDHEIRDASLEQWAQRQGYTPPPPTKGY